MLTLKSMTVNFNILKDISKITDRNYITKNVLSNVCLYIENKLLT